MRRQVAKRSKICQKIRSGLSVTFLSVTLVPIFHCDFGVADTSNCFHSTDVSKYTIIEQAPPPREDLSRYRYYPVTIAATARIDRVINNRSDIVGAYWLWANHGPRSFDKGAKGNITAGSPGVQIRFSSIAAANECTMLQTKAAIQDAPLLYSSKLHVTSENQKQDTLDVCIVPKNKVPPQTIIFLDYEVQDDRTANDGYQFLKAWADLVHLGGHVAYLYSNPLDAPSQTRTNLTPKIPAVVRIFDKVHILLWSRNAQNSLSKSFYRQLELSEAGPEKIIVAFELNNTSLDDAKFVNHLLKTKEISAVTLWRNHAVVGGSCTREVNMKIACIAFDRCS